MAIWRCGYDGYEEADTGSWLPPIDCPHHDSGINDFWTAWELIETCANCGTQYDPRGKPCPTCGLKVANPRSTGCLSSCSGCFLTFLMLAAVIGLFVMIL